MSIDFRKHRNQIFELRFSRQASTHGISYIFFLLLLLSQAAAQSSAPASNPYGGLDANFNPSMAIIIVVLISAFFFMGFFSVYIRQCAGEGSTTSTSVRRAGNGNTGRSRRGQRGLDPSVIETFPTFLYSEVKGLQIGKGILECAVCLNEFEDDETLRMLPKCDHVFHPECIDAWLISHSTCPVCRANLASESGITATDGVATGDNAPGVSDSESESDHAPEIESVAINVRNEDSRCSEQHHQQQQPDVVSPSTLPIQNRPVRSKSIREKIFGRFPRSHSTGHSLIQPGENCERFTLRLPEDVRKQIMLNRTTSCVAFPPDEGSFSRRSSRRGYRGAVGEGSSRGKYYQFWKIDAQRAKSDRWVFSKAPPFLSRGPSVWSPKGVDGEGSVNSRSFLTSVKTPFDCLNAKGDGSQQDSSRLPV